MPKIDGREFMLNEQSPCFKMCFKEEATLVNLIQVEVKEEETEGQTESVHAWMASETCLCNKKNNKSREQSGCIMSLLLVSLFAQMV